MENLKNNRTLQIGLVIYAISAIAFLITINPEQNGNLDLVSGAFFFNYGAFLIYFFIVLFSNKRRFERFFHFDISESILLLLLAFISAYSLNRSVAVFQISTEWLCMFITVLNVGLLYFSLSKSYLNTRVNHTLVALLSAGFLYGFYGVLYTIPIAPISLVVCWFFGFTLHTFVPLFTMILCGILVLKFIKSDEDFKISALVGIALPLVFITVYVGKWSMVNHHIKEIRKEAAVPLQEQELPNWIQLAQRMEKNSFTEKILKSGIVYTVYNRRTGDWFGADFSGGRLNERRKHDPLIMIASLFSSPLTVNNSSFLNTNRSSNNANSLSFKEHRDILNALYERRHQTQRKLWSGENCETTNILTNAQLFPEYRLAYTEKTIDISNNSKVNNTPWSGFQQEALYTFYLPEGSVVTSASLWVEGEERPSFLTTRNKADSAYTAIVGRERRDPLLLHWQEGNQVTVRIFPVTPDLPRKFKVGITTPLKYENDQLTYENIDFAGPYWKGAEEQINLVVEGQLKDLNSSLNLETEGDHWSYSGNYKSDWNLRFAAPPLSKNTFSFNGKTFQMQANARATENFTPTEIYLDVNGAWSESEFEDLMERFSDVPIYVFKGKLIQLDENNEDRLFDELEELNFSLFPFHQIKNPKTALVFTKNHFPSPVLDDLKKTKFSKSLNEFLAKNNAPITVYNLGNNLSNYLKTLKELRAVDVIADDFAAIEKVASDGTFDYLQENILTVALDVADVKIQEITTLSTTESAPDHLMRLFTYNDLMKKIGQKYFDKKKYEDELVTQAEEGYVVTPISSLIVLETQADYDRFDIKRSKNSLKNASFKNSGSVPEPHEWMLIILCLIVGSRLVWRTYF